MLSTLLEPVCDCNRKTAMNLGIALISADDNNAALYVGFSSSKNENDKNIQLE